MSKDYRRIESLLQKLLYCESEFIKISLVTIVSFFEKKNVLSMHVLNHNHIHRQGIGIAFYLFILKKMKSSIFCLKLFNLNFNFSIKL